MSNENPMLKKILQSLEEIKAIDVTVIDVSKQTTITDYMIICSGRSTRHVNAVASHVLEHMKASGLSVLGTTGFETNEWIIIDFGDFVVHVMQPENRDFYNLEGLWQN